MDNTMYLIELGAYQGFCLGVRYDNSWVGKRISFEIGFIYLTFCFYSKQEKLRYPVKLFRLN